MVLTRVESRVEGTSRNFFFGGGTYFQTRFRDRVIPLCICRMLLVYYVPLCFSRMSPVVLVLLWRQNWTCIQTVAYIFTLPDARLTQLRNDTASHVDRNDRNIAQGEQYDRLTFLSYLITGNQLNKRAEVMRYPLYTHCRCNQKVFSEV